MPNRRHFLTQNRNSKSFKVIYFDVTENPLIDYILQYNSCASIVCYSLGNIVHVSERSENRHFWPAHSHLTPPLQRTLANICIKLILPETRIPELYVCRCWYGSIFIQILVVPKNVCNATVHCRSKSFQGQPRSLILVPIESAYTISY